MNANRLVRFAGFVALLIAALMPLRAQDTNSAVRSGESVTPLPDGSTLVLGGFGADGRPLAAANLVDKSGHVQNLGGMQSPRAGQTATVLPDGTVLIFGGFAADGKTLAGSELFDPVTLTFSSLPDMLAVPRAFHTATVLTDGTVLLAGGVEIGGELPSDVQLWDFRSHRVLSQQAMLTPRRGHTATLLSDGAVRISGGTDRFGRPVLVNEIYDPTTRRFRFSSPGEMQSALQGDSQAGLQVAESIPVDGAGDVPISSLIALRFTRLLNVGQVSAANFVLRGPDESSVQAKVTAAENGRLVFVLPAAPLQPGTTYTLTVRNAADAAGNNLDASISFTTEGEPMDGSGADAAGTTSTSKFQELPPLQAHPGQTAVSGQVLKLNGWPLEGVTLEMDGHKTRTDSTGRFLLQDLTPGHHVLWIEGSTANQAGAEYGTYEVGVTVLANKTNLLNYTIWMTRLDTAHTVNIPSPTARETVITNPNLPGLELHLPANTVVTDRYGHVVHRISITAIPVDKPPFPLPAGVQVPIYFTIQPGGAYIKVLNTSGPQGARLIYPNAFNLSPGTGFDFWNYDADAKGWFIYGQGKVSGDGRQVIPDPGVVIYEFTGAMVGTDDDAPGTFNPAGSQPKNKSGDPVNLSTGQFSLDKTDLFLPDTIPITFTRTYITNDSRSRSFGIGATSAYDIFMGGDINPYTFQELILPDGGRIRFNRVSAGTSYTDAVYLHTNSQDPYYGARIVWNNDPETPSTWQMTLRDGSVFYFPEAAGVTSPFCQAVIQIRDRYGNRIKLDRATGSCYLTKVTSSNGRYINVTSDSQGRITQLQDNLGRTVSYTYDAAGRLSTVTDAGGGVTTYTYDDQNRMLTIKDPRGIVYLTNQYDSSGRVIQQTNADSGTYAFAWTGSLNTNQVWVSAGGAVSIGDVMGFRNCSICNAGYTNRVAQVDVTDPRGYVRRVVFNSNGYISSDIHALGQPEQQTVTYAYYADNLLKSVTDSLGRTTSFTYDIVANTTSVTRLAGTPNAVTSTMVYGGFFNQLLSATDPLNHSSTFSYDFSGDLLTATNPLGQQFNFTYNNVGQKTSATDALNHTVQFGYFAGDLVSTTDPLGSVSTTYFDPAGRLLLNTNAIGQKTSMQYDGLNQLSQVTDPAGNVSQFTYDANGNPLSLTDALGHITSYTYDNMDRRATRTDPLLRTEHYSYDLNGNLASVTDRKGQVTAFTYDGLNRPVNLCFGQTVNGGVVSCVSTIGYQYDLPNRRVIITDSLAGTITRSFDNLGHLISEVTPQGSITYTYDAAGRLITSTVAGQPQATYSYDVGSRVISITKGTQSVQFSYDAVSRLSSMTLPNSIVASYSYDAGSKVTSITYTLGQTTIGNLTYTYDTLNRRIAVGGSLARTVLPAGVNSATYDAANQVATWNGTAFTYDSDGNLLSDGANAYSWDARGQLSGISGGVAASFGYDAFGRRISKAIGANNTGFFYNGGAITQELSGSTVTANISNGGTSYFQRTDSSGSVAPLVDALGSVVGLADSNGNLNSHYSYDPFGGTTVSGAASANAYQYIGQENDLTGLYYFHARYYSPALHRFISEDPLGFGGGDVNLHAYSFSSPTNFRDPGGKNPLVACGVGGLVNVGYNALTGRKVTLGNIADDFVSGCETGVLMEITGVNWAIGKLFSGVADVGSWVAGKLFSGEIEAAADAVLGDVATACGLCFPAGTPVMSRNGPVSIERIKVGDEVLSRNRQTGTLEYKRVTALVPPHPSKLLQVYIAAEPNPLQPTPEHPFLVRRAAGVQADWVQAVELQVGDSVLTAAGTWSEVLAISPLEKEQLVYNFEVEENHDYFVGSAGLLVHNADCGNLQQTLRAIADTYPAASGECAECAAAMRDALTGAGQSASIVMIDGGGEAIFSNTGVMVADAESSFHLGVLSNGAIYDALSPGGVAQGTWSSLFSVPSRATLESVTISEDLFRYFLGR